MLWVLIYFNIRGTGIVFVIFQCTFTFKFQKLILTIAVLKSTIILTYKDYDKH